MQQLSLPWFTFNRMLLKSDWRFATLFSKLWRLVDKFLETSFIQRSVASSLFLTSDSRPLTLFSATFTVVVTFVDAWFTKLSRVVIKVSFVSRSCRICIRKFCSNSSLNCTSWLTFCFKFWTSDFRFCTSWFIICFKFWTSKASLDTSAICKDDPVSAKHPDIKISRSTTFIFSENIVASYTLVYWNENELNHVHV